MTGNDKTILQTHDLGKEFSGVWVLKNIDFNLRAGEIHALAGENGAGKSTFIKILSGLYSPASGSITLRGRDTTFDSVQMSEDAGIRTVHQEINLVPFFKVYQNIFMGDELYTSLAGVRYTRDRKMRKKAREVLDKLGTDLPTDTYTHNLDASHQRIVQIAKVLTQEPAIMIFDEPTTSLGESERELLLDIIVSLKQHGIGIIYISHNLDEIMKVADRVTVFRDGSLIGTKPISDLTPQSIVSMMIGQKEYDSYKRNRKRTADSVLLSGRGLTNHRLHNINFSLHHGEILGIAGVVGAGKSELAQAIFGVDRLLEGNLQFNGSSFRPSADFSLKNGIALVPEERQEQGLVPTFSLEKNITLSYLKGFRKGLVIDHAKERTTAEQYIQNLSIRTTGPDQIIKYLSGGNQQKAVLSRWLHGDFEIGLFDEPTKGIDVKAKEEIYLLIGALAERGKGIMFFSSYLPELLNVCDRILVLNDGKLNGEFDPEDDGCHQNIIHAMLTEGSDYEQQKGV
jgi:ribose transport system ATP-binding protein